MLQPMITDEEYDMLPLQTQKSYIWSNVLQKYALKERYREESNRKEYYSMERLLAAIRKENKIVIEKRKE